MSQDTDSDGVSSEDEACLGGLPSGYDETVGRRDGEIEELRVQRDTGELFFDLMYGKRSHLARLHTAQLQGRLFDHSGTTSMQMSATSDSEGTTGIVQVSSHDGGANTAGAVTVDFRLLNVTDDSDKPLLNGTTTMTGLFELRPDELRRLIEALVDGHNEIVSGVDVTADLVADADAVDADNGVDEDETADGVDEADGESELLDLSHGDDVNTDASLSLLRDATGL